MISKQSFDCERTLVSIKIDDLCLGRPLRKGIVHTAKPFEIIPYSRI